MTGLHFTTQVIENRGTNATMRYQDSTSAIFVPVEAPESVSGLLGILNSVANVANSDAFNRELSDAGKQKKLRDVLASAPAQFQKATKDVVQARRALAKRVANLDALPSVTDGHLEQDFRRAFIEMNTVGKAKAIPVMNIEALTAILRAGQTAMGCDMTLWTALQERYRLLSLVQKLGLQAEFAHLPSLENPSAYEPDTQAAIERANEMLRGMLLEREVLDNLARSLQQFAMIIGVMLLVRSEVAFDWLSGNVSQI